MRKTGRILRVLSLGSFCVLGSAQAQIQLPPVSPAASVKAVVGLTEVEISYHRPGVKGRKIFGAMLPWGEVWRLGANEATTIRFATDVKVEGRGVPAGTYALFAIPGPERWTLILNKQAKQWGAFRYKPAEDLLRFDVQPRSGPFIEWMGFAIDPQSRSKAVVEMAWDTVRVPFTVETDVDEAVWSQIDKTLAGKPEWSDYLQAAQYALFAEQRLDEAMGWIEKAHALQEGFWYHEVKAKLLQKQGEIGEALEQLDLALAGARDQMPRDFLWNLEQLKAEWTKALPPPT